MAKIYIEVCLISARGLPRPSPFLQPQWFAVGWIDPNNKYCTKIHTSGSANPTWKTKFSIAIDEASSTGVQGLELTAEVYKREPIFLREKLQGTAVIPLKEFLVKFLNDASRSNGVKESGSFQLRKGNSGKPHGFIDISVHISERSSTGHYATDHPGMDEGFKYSDNKEGITLAIDDGPVLAFPSYNSQPPSLANYPGGGYNCNSYPHYIPRPPPPTTSYTNNAMPPGAAYHRPPTPPPALPPSSAGFFPGTSPPPETYVNLPASGPVRPSSGAGFGMGVGAGALAAGAVIFGDDFMSGSNFPVGIKDDSSLTLSVDTPF